MNIYSLTGCVNRYGRVKLCKTQRQTSGYILIQSANAKRRQSKSPTGCWQSKSPAGCRQSKRTLKFKIDFLLTHNHKKGGKDIKKAARYLIAALSTKKKGGKDIPAILSIGQPLFSFANHICYWTGVHRQSLLSLCRLLTRRMVDVLTLPRHS